MAHAPETGAGAGAGGLVVGGGVLGTGVLGTGGLGTGVLGTGVGGGGVVAVVGVSTILSTRAQAPALARPSSLMVSPELSATLLTVKLCRVPRG